MSVDSNAAVTDAPQTDTIAVTDDALGAVWDRMERDNGASRAADGKFASDKPEIVDETPPAGGAGPLEGGEGGETAADEGSTAPAAVPLPSNWQSSEMKEIWAKLPPDLQGPIAAHDLKLRQKLGEQGQALSSWKPIADTFKDFEGYFNGEKANYKPEVAVRALFETVRDLDNKPVETLVQIARDYGVLEQLAGAFRRDGDDANAVQTQNAALIAKISELENIIRSQGSGFKPEIVDERVSQILFEKDEHAAAQDAISRSLKDMPLLDDVPEEDMVAFINKAKVKLNGTASKEAVLKLAYDMAVHADPDLRARAAALKGAAVNEAGKVADAKRAGSVNLQSTSAGKARVLSEDELLGNLYDTLKKG